MSLDAATAATTGTTRSSSSASLTSAVSGREGHAADVHPARAGLVRRQRGADGLVQSEGPALVEERIRGAVDDAHDDDLRDRSRTCAARCVRTGSASGGR